MKKRHLNSECQSKEIYKDILSDMPYNLQSITYKSAAKWQKKTSFLTSQKYFIKKKDKQKTL